MGEEKGSVGAKFVLIAIIMVSAGAAVSAIDGNFDTLADSGTTDNSVTSDTGTDAVSADGNFDVPSPGNEIVVSPVNPSEILLKSRQFIPEPGINQTFEAELLASEEATVHVLLQLYHAPTDAERRLLEENNVRLLAYLPHNAWFASIPPANVTEVVTLPAVRWVGKILPEDKISPQIRDDGVDSWAINEDGTVNLTVLFFRDFSLDDASRLIPNYGGIIVRRAPIINALIVVVPNETIPYFAVEDSVQWINELYPPASNANDGSRAAIDVNTLQAPPYNLDGTDVQIGEWEHNGWVNYTHPDLIGRVTIGDNESADPDNTYPENKIYGVDVVMSDHATHVAGTMVGDGNLSESEGEGPLQWRGMATNATVVSYEDWEGTSELYYEYADAINDRGIDLSQNSWRWWDNSGTYDERCEAIDSVVRGNISGNLTRAIPIIWIAGNEYDNYGWTSIGIPGGAKNVITVGATNSNDDSIWADSSRGPTGDNRTKPDVMAPGCEVGGNKIFSTGYNISKGRYPYYSNCGTSMAAPVVSGSVALMLQDYRATHDNSEPLPSTVKAILIHTAKDLNNTGPDFSTGYGRIDVLAAINLIEADNSPQQRIIEAEIDDLETDTYNITVPAGMPELKVTLVWDDYPGTPNGGRMLVNDLNLLVTAPNGSKYYPWILNASDLDEPAKTGIDAVNNVEQVVITSPASGTYNITVNGSNIPNGPQNYSLILPDVVLPTVTITAPSGATNDTAPELNFTVDEPAHTLYSWDLEGNISGCRMCTSFNTTYGESVMDANTSILLHFNENFDDTAFDDSTNGNDGTLGNATLATHPDWVSGRFGYALDFDGDNDFVRVADDDSIDFDNDSNYSFTMMFWVKTGDSAFSEETQYIFDKSSSGGSYNGYHMYINSSDSYKLRFMYHQEAQNTLDIFSTGPIHDGEWHHIAVVRNTTADKGYLYIDGTENSSATDNTKNPGNNSGDLYIGANGPAWNNFNGTIDDFHIIARALNETEIEAIYNKTLPEGSHTVTVYANDTAGNLNSTSVSFTTDTTPPTWDEIPTDQTVEANTTFTYDVNATDSVGIDTYFINDTTNFAIGPTDGIITNNTVLNLGAYGLNISVNDTSNNVNSTVITITVQDTTPPTWDEIPTDQTVEANTTFTYDVNATDSVGIDTYFINDTTNFAIGPTDGIITNNTVLNLGAYGLNISVNDTSNNVNSTVITITVQDTTPPTISNPQFNETTVDPTEAVRFNVTVTDAASNVDTVIATFRKPDTSEVNKTLSLLSGDTYHYNWTNTSATGTYNVTYIWANDTLGNANGTTYTNVSFTVAYNISLNQYWNLISIPLEQSNWSLTSVLSSIEGKYTIVFEYRDGGWRRSTAPRSPLTNMSLEYGYWINMSEPAVLELSGTVPSVTTINVSTGWNLVGHPSLIAQNLTIVLSPINYTVVFEYDDGWKRSTAPRSPLTHMSPDYGYWINATADGSYEVTN